MATGEAGKGVQRRMPSVSIAENFTNNTLNDATSFRERVAFVGTRKREWLSSLSLASSQIARSFADWHPAHDTMSAQSRQLGKIAQLQRSIEVLKDNMAFYDASEDIVTAGLEAVMTESTWLGQVFDSLCRNG